MPDPLKRIIKIKEYDIIGKIFKKTFLLSGRTIYSSLIHSVVSVRRRQMVLVEK